MAMSLYIVEERQESGRIARRRASKSWRTTNTISDICACRFCLRWAADGRSFLGISLYPAENQTEWRIAKIDAANGEFVSLVSAVPGTVFRQLDLSPDGQTLYYMRDNYSKNSSEVALRNLSSGSGLILYDTGLESCSGMRLSPDGRWLAITDSGAKKGIYVLPVSGGTPKEVFADRTALLGRSSLGWSPDGRFVFFTRLSADGKRRYGLWRISVAGGEPQSLGVEMQGHAILTVHPDGRQIAYCAGTPWAEIWVMENILPSAANPKK